VGVLARAVQAAHEAGIVHRDLKPANVLLSTDGTPKVTDFGLAKKLGGAAGQTASGAILGTPSYMAPEQAAGRGKEVGPAADIWALGAILYECLTGRPPFKAATPLDTVLQVLSEEPVPPGRLLPNLPRDLETICLKCLQKDPRKRYARADALAEDVGRFLDGKPIEARPVPAWERGLKWVRRRPAAAGLIAVSVLALLTLIAGGLVYQSQLQKAVRTAERRRQDAQEAGERAQTKEAEARQQEKAATEQRRLAEANLQKAREAVGQMLQLDQSLTEVQLLGQAARGEVPEVPHTDPVVQEELAERALRFYHELAGKAQAAAEVRWEAARACRHVADVRQLLGHHAKAEEAYRQAIRLLEKLAADSSDSVPYARELAEDYHSLGVLKQGNGQPADAAVSFRRAMEIRARLVREHPEWQPELATTFNALAMLYESQGDYAHAEPLYRQALDIRQARLAPDHPDVALSVNRLADVWRVTGHPAEAEALYRDRLKTLDEKLGPDHPDVARALGELGLLYQAGGQQQRAESLFRGALEVWAKRPDDPDAARAWGYLGSLYAARGEPGKAEEPYRHALKILEDRLGPDHPDVAGTLNQLANIYASSRRWGEAAEVSDQSCRILRRHVGRTLPLLAESEQLAFLRTQYDPAFHQALSLGLARRDDPALAALSAGWVLNGKGVGQRALIERGLLTHNRADVQTGELLQRLLAIRRQLAVLTVPGRVAAQGEAEQQRVARLGRQEDEICLQMGLAGRSHLRRDASVQLDEVRRVLPLKAVLIEIARLPVWNFRVKGTRQAWQASHYAAWVIPPEGPVTVFDLGPAEAIDAAVQRLRKEIQAAYLGPGGNPDEATLRTRGDAASEELFRKRSRELADLLLRPMYPEISRYERWLVSPDAALWLVPWAALILPTDDMAGAYAVEKHTISFVFSSRELVVPPTPPVRTGPPLILADPDFGQRPGERPGERRDQPLPGAEGLLGPDVGESPASKPGPCSFSSGSRSAGPRPGRSNLIWPGTPGARYSSR
jgi:tetratricopeptide (TPR) repeat protein